MSVRYTVTHFNFRPPSVLASYEYADLKKKLQNNPDFSLFNKKESFANQYLNEIIVGILLIPVLGFGIIFILTQLQTWNSYAKYIRKKREYFLRMEEHIRKSSNYEDFVKTFYK